LDSRSLLVTVDEAARLLRLSRSSIYILISRGLLRTVHLGRARRVLFEDVVRIAREGVPPHARGA